jgi:hypothetical protein
MPMVTRYVSRLEKMGAPPWVRGLGVAVLAVGLVGNLALITFSWAPHGGARVYAIVALLWILALGALVLLVRLWRATVSRK